MRHSRSGRSPRRDFLPFAKPLIGDEEIAAVVAAMKSGWLSMGPRVKSFEQAFAEFTGAKYAVAVSSATAGLHLALEAIGIQPGDEVITTPYTFAATAEVIRYFGAHPVFVDIRREDLNINPDRIEAAISPNTRAIVPVHIAGQSCDMTTIQDLATKNGLKVIEDAAHALPTQYRGKMIGTISELTVFSFYATKNLTTGEGGMVTTNNQSLAERIEVMRLHGISRSAWNRYAAGGSWRYEIVEPGFKYNLTDPAAALGLCQLSRVEAMTLRRSEIATRYSAAFADSAALEIPLTNSNSTHAWHLYLLRLNLNHLKFGRDKFVELLTELNIGTSVHFIPLHLHPYYRSQYGYEEDSFPIATREFLRTISLPIYAAMSDDDVEDVIAAVLDVAGYALHGE